MSSQRTRTSALAEAILQVLGSEAKTFLQPLIFESNHRLTFKVLGSGDLCRKTRHDVERAILKMQGDGSLSGGVKYMVTVQAPPEERQRRSEVSQKADAFRLWAGRWLHDDDPRRRLAIAWHAFPQLKVGNVVVGKFVNGEGAGQWEWMTKNIQRLVGQELVLAELLDLAAE